MDTSQLFNPLAYGKITHSEAAQNDAPYVRNNISDKLREYINKKFSINNNDWHIEEGNGDDLLIISNKDEVVRKYNV